MAKQKNISDELYDALKYNNKKLAYELALRIKPDEIRSFHIGMINENIGEKNSRKHIPLPILNHLTIDGRILKELIAKAPIGVLEKAQEYRWAERAKIYHGRNIRVKDVLLNKAVDNYEYSQADEAYRQKKMAEFEKIEALKAAERPQKSVKKAVVPDNKPVAAEPAVEQPVPEITAQKEAPSTTASVVSAQPSGGQEVKPEKDIGDKAHAGYVAKLREQESAVRSQG